VPHRLRAAARSSMSIKALAAYGWGRMWGRSYGAQRHILRVLAGAPEGGLVTTAAQIAATAGISERWARTCLHRLESAGIITWRRGTLDNGTPRPGFIRIVWETVALLVDEAKAIAEERAQAAREALAMALTRLQTTTQPAPWRRRLARQGKTPSHHGRNSDQSPTGPVGGTRKRAPREDAASGGHTCESSTDSLNRGPELTPQQMSAARKAYPGWSDAQITKITLLKGLRWWGFEC
jgi:alkylated DNA nucleotide flippase Atl1